MICLLTAPLPPCLDIPPARTATAQTHLHQPSKNGEPASDPHEHKERDSNRGTNIQLLDASDGIAEDDEHDGCDDGCSRNDEGVEECDDGDGEGEPAREDGNGHQEDEDEGEAGAGEEEAEHPLRDVLDKVEDIINISGKVNY